MAPSERLLGAHRPGEFLKYQWFSAKRGEDFDCFCGTGPLVLGVPLVPSKKTHPDSCAAVAHSSRDRTVEA